MQNKKKKLRTVTLFYLREEERQIFLNLVPELKKKFKVKFSTNLNSKADIGFYCQTNIKKINSNVSAIFLGGMDQGRSDWPNHWKKERWDKFDLGFLPGKSWEKRWKLSSDFFETRTKHGVFNVGWPKADHLFKKKDKKNSINKKKTNILYAPSFECCNKQIDVVNSVKKLGYNLIIKHWLIKKEKRYIDLWNNIKSANNFSKKIYKKIKIINPKKNFLNLLRSANVVITDESSVAYEALMFDLPTISVKNWKIQRHNKAIARDVKPAEITFKTTKKNLSKSIFLMTKLSKNKFKNLKFKHFSYLGKSSQAIVNVLTNFLSDKKSISKNIYYIKPKKKLSILERTKKIIY